MKPKYPQVKVQLTDEDGNAFAILGRVRREMRKAKLTKDQIEEFTAEAKSGDYDHLLQICFKYVDVH